VLLTAQHVLTLVQMHRLLITLPRVISTGSGRFASPSQTASTGPSAPARGVADAPRPIPPGFAMNPAWKMAATRSWRAGREEESVMGVAKKAKREAKAAKSKTKKGAGKVKHKGKKAKNAAKH
jgi:hypothetical protein